MKNNDIKNSIIDATIYIIEESDGDIKNITARKIADRCGVALGLINYHFGSKENLIAECCDRIINEMLSGLAPDKIDYTADDGLSDRERLILYARQTFDYIYSNPSIVKISILSDLKDYKPNGNSVLTQKGFQLALRGKMPESKKTYCIFACICYAGSISFRREFQADNRIQITEQKTKRKIYLRHRHDAY